MGVRVYSSMESPSLLPPPLRSSTIDSLPASLITEEILTRLPICEAVQTSVLSRAWRQRWRSIPKIQFIDTDRVELTAIDRVLLLHSASIRSFSVDGSTITVPDADQWLLNLSRSHHRSLSELQLGFTGDQQQPLRPPLHSSLFTFRSLQSLDLSYCSIPPTSSNASSFPLLQSLHLDCVNCPSDTYITDLISNSPKLTSLIILEISPSPPNLLITNPNLRYFDFYGEDCSSIVFAANQVLQMVCITINGDCAKFDLAQSFPAGAVCNEGLAKRGIPKSIPNCFQNLILLELNIDFAVMREIMFLLCLMRSAPNLQKLIVNEDGIISDNDRDEHIRLDTDFWKDHNVGQLDRLRTLELKLLWFVEAKFDFILYVLEKARLLQKVIITNLSESASLIDSKLSMLGTYQRASPQVEIIYNE